MKSLLLMILLSSGPLLAQPLSATYIGDSHSTTSYGLFEKLLGQKSVGLEQVVRARDGRAVCGASINAYLDRRAQTNCGFKKIVDGKATQKHIKKGKSVTSQTLLKSETDLVMVQLGGNHLRKPKTAYPAAKKLIRRISAAGKKCVWIGTPAPHNSKKQAQCKRVGDARKKINLYIKAAIRELADEGIQCEFIDSPKLLKGKKLYASDCRHYNGSGYSAWAKAIQPKIKELLSEKKNLSPKVEPLVEEDSPVDTAPLVNNAPAQNDDSSFFSFEMAGAQ